MRNKIKGFIVGIIVTLIITNTIGFAISSKKEIIVKLNSIKVLVDWKELKSDNILYNGTTYVPIRTVSEMLGKKLTWNPKTQTANILNKTSEDIVNEVKDKIDRAKTKKPKEKGKSYIDISANSEPIYWVIDKRTDNEHWFYTLVFKETNGVGLNVEEIRETYYTNIDGGHYIKYNKYDIKNWWGSNRIEPNSFKTFSGGGNRCDTAYIVWSIKGIDDNGNNVEYEYCMTMSQEPASAHYDEVFSILNDAKKLQENSKDKSYLNIYIEDDMIYADEGYWYYNLYFDEINGIGLTVEEVIQYPFNYHGIGNLNIYNKEDIKGWWGSNYISPYDHKILFSGSPADITEHFVWVVKGTDDNGNKVEYKYIVNMSREEYNDMMRNKEYDTINLRYNAKFEKEVGDGVWWVPARKLGDSDYKNDEIAEIVYNTPEEKQDKIDTLYEALQLYQISNFSSGADNVRIFENGIDWEHHEPGYHAVRTNNGNCASSSNWLNYILKDDYEEVGFIEISWINGNGHVFNYIKYNGYYYVIDLTHYRLDFIDASSVETGKINDHKNSDRVLGNIHKVEDLKDYINYLRENSNDPAVFAAYYTAEDAPPLDGVYNKGIVERTYPYTVDLKIIYDDLNDTLVPKFNSYPTKENDWENDPSAEFNPILFD